MHKAGRPLCTAAKQYSSHAFAMPILRANGQHSTSYYMDGKADVSEGRMLKASIECAPCMLST